VVRLLQAKAPVTLVSAADIQLGVDICKAAHEVAMAEYLWQGLFELDQASSGFDSDALVPAALV
jgi:hypothetical protein